MLISGSGPLSFTWGNGFDGTRALERKTNATGWLVACVGLSSEALRLWFAVWLRTQSSSLCLGSGAALAGALTAVWPLFLTLAGN